MKTYTLSLETTTPAADQSSFLHVSHLSEPKRVHPIWKVGLAGTLGSPVRFYIDEPRVLHLSGHLPAALYRDLTPFSAHTVHLFEDEASIWSLSFPPAFEEIDHTADIAFAVKGEDLEQLHYHALVALAFYEPQMIPFIPIPRSSADLDTIIIHLNSLITKIDTESGCAFKAVSFHGRIKEMQGFLQWEMMIDV
ncbi:putative uncharacterized protein [Waddlia chondrophila 2032/99]|uniref:Uncharacterized protein n=1 Tax=Waddlia chondrophila 2032/99 TaxID=765953 RepID=F8LCU4_9BACT|nr:putative uncharacterized protein [Waddlia chondrophila 2032/99]